MAMLRTVKVELQNNRIYIGKIDWNKEVVFITPLKEDHLNVETLTVKGIKFKVIDKIKEPKTSSWCLSLRRT